MLTYLKERIVSARQDDGLSLLEIVIAVAIIAIFLAAGIIGFQRLTNNARDTAVNSAAQQVYTAAAAELSGVGAAALDRVESDYNDSADGVVVSVSGSDMDSLCVVAEYDAHSAERGSCVDTASGDTDNGQGNTGQKMAAPTNVQCLDTPDALSYLHWDSPEGVNPDAYRLTFDNDSGNEIYTIDVDGKNTSLYVNRELIENMTGRTMPPLEPFRVSVQAVKTGYEDSDSAVSRNFLMTGIVHYGGSACGPDF